MPLFNYRGRDSTGKPVNGSIEAENPAALLDNLRTQGYFVFEVRRKRENALFSRLLSRKRRIKFTELVIFCREFAAMIDAGIPILQSLNILIEQSENRTLKETLIRMRDMVEEGKSLHDALKEESQTFSPLFINTVMAGEIGGNLEQVLDRMAFHIEEEADLKNKVRSAFFYPVILIFMSVSLVTFLTSFVLPKFAIIFEEANVPLPLPTLLLMGLSKFFCHYWSIILLILFGLVIFLRLYFHTGKGKRQFDLAKLKLPILGKFFQKTLATEFSSTLGMLIVSGISLLSGLRVVKEVLNNQIVKEALERVITGITAGKSFSKLLGEERLFPPMVPQMSFIGEKSGKLDEMLKKISELLTKEVTYAIKRMTVLIEPIILVFLGGVVLLIASSIFLPLFRLIQTIQR